VIKTKSEIDGNVKIPVFDGHNDVIMLLCEESRNFTEKSDQGHFDIPRAIEGGFAGGLFAVFVPPEIQDESPVSVGHSLPSDDDPELSEIDAGYAHSVTEKGIDALYQLEKQSGGNLKVATSTRDIRDHLKQGTISALLHFEGAEAINQDLSNLSYFYDRGLRSIGLVWSRPNVFGQGVNFAFPGSPDQGPGLTEAGKKLVRTCNQMGIMIDMSHLNEKGFWDVKRISEKPLVATHSCMHTLTPVSRNLTDHQLKAVRDSGGVVGINFCPAFIRKDGKLTEKTPVSDIVRHIRYGAERMGIDHIALGSDFDGVLLPEEIRDVTGLPVIVSALFDDGFDEASVMKITHENWIRVLSETI